MKRTSRHNFIIGVTVSYAAFGAAWILLSDRLLTAFVMPSIIIEFGLAKGLAFIAVTTTLLFVALHLVPPEEDADQPIEARVRLGPYRLVAAALPVAAAFLTQWTFWSVFQPFAWFLFFPAVFVASWVGGVMSGVAATILATLLTWWAFVPPKYTFELENPQSGVAIGMFFAMGVLFSLTHERLRRAEKKAAEAKFRGLMEQALAGIYILQGGRVRFANRELARMFGYPSADAVVERLGLAELAAPEDFRSLDEDARRCLAGELPELRRNFVGVRRDGALIDVETHALGLEFEGGPAIIGIALDVTLRRRAEEALRRSEALLRAVVDGSTDAVFVKDAAGRYLLFNEAAGRFVGMPPDVVKGRDDSEIFPPDVAESIRALDRGVMERGAVDTHGETIRTRDGRQLDFLVTKGPIFDEKGQVVGLFGVSRDVTESRHAQAMLQTLNQRLENEVAARTEELKAAEERARLILQSSGAGMFGCDLDGRITFANPAAGRMLNCAAEDLIGADAHWLLAPADHGAGSPLGAVLAQGEAVVNDNAAFTRPDGRPLSVSYAAQPMRQDDSAGGSVVVGAVVSFSDVSERRAAEEAREQALEETRRLAQSRSAFLANMSHEIRTPLNAVLGLAQVGALKGDGRQAQPLFQQILDSGRQLLEIVDDVLDYSKIEAGKLTVESALIDPGVALDRAIAQVAERAAEKRLRFTVTETADFPARCRGDALRLSQILANLLSNAVKFTDSDGAVGVTAGVIDDGGGRWLAFAVADTGVGVSEEHLPHLFTPFEQADTSITRRFGGTGLGLSICKRLAEAMDGEIRVSSRLGEGSRFELRLPLLDAEPPQPVPGALTVCACGLSGDEATLLG
ncbi:MAG TPA: PAS domain S-box protein, partial [Azospirillaceae bacterium]|nr:PAS domain S-box protein [Azospirillaceae bacterium]